MMTPDKTSTLLVEHLYAKPESVARDGIIRMAKGLEYDDFGSLHATPKTNLYYDLHQAGFADLAKNVTEGVYDR